MAVLLVLTSSLHSVLFLVLAAVTISVVHSQGCDDCSGIGTVSCDSSLGQCVCQPGVSGPRCSNCLPGYTGFSAQGCRLECECDRTGSLGRGCSGEGVCQCHPRATGDQCASCSFGYHEFSKGCNPCPPCFNGVSMQFTRASELYQMLFSQLNSSLPVGVTPTLLARINQNKELLELLLERASNASMREARLTSEEAAFSQTYSSFDDLVSQFFSNLTSAEEELNELWQRLNISLDALNDLSLGLQNLTMTLGNDMRVQLEEATMLFQDIANLQLSLVEASSEANQNSLLLLEIANDLHRRILIVLSVASSSLQRLYNAAALQNSTIAVVQGADTTLDVLEDRLALGEEALDNANVTVPEATSEASRVFTSVASIFMDDSTLNTAGADLQKLQEDFESIQNSVAEVSFLSDNLQTEVSSLSNSVAIILEESEQLNSEASVLVQRSGDALLLANDSTTRGNAIIAEAEYLLMQIQNRSNNIGFLVIGLNEVIMNVERAEDLSRAATMETLQIDSEVRRLATDLRIAMELLEQASRNLNETLRLAIELETGSSKLQTDSSTLTNETVALAQDIPIETEKVDELELALDVDRNVIAMVTDIANETLDLASNIARRIEIANNIILNLTRELNNTLTLPTGRLQGLQSVLTSLEALFDSNQMEVDGLSIEIRKLQESTNGLRQSYISLQQHRDLLQQILDNVDPLDCTEQIAAP